MLQHGSFAGKPNPQTTKGKHPPASKPKAPAPAKTSQGPSKQQPKPKAPAQAKPHLKQQQQPRPTAAAPPKPAPRATLRHPAQQAQRASAGKAPDEETLASNYARLAAEDRGSLRFEGELRWAQCCCPAVCAQAGGAAVSLSACSANAVASRARLLKRPAQQNKTVSRREVNCLC